MDTGAPYFTRLRGPPSIVLTFGVNSPWFSGEPYVLPIVIAEHQCVGSSERLPFRSLSFAS